MSTPPTGLLATVSDPAAARSLRSLLASLLRSGAGTNPALDALIRDYAAFHRVLGIVGGLFLLAVAALAVVLLRRFRRARRDAESSAFERRTYATFAALAVVVGLFLALVVAANISTAASPRSGFSGSLALLGNPAAGSRADALQDSVATWVRSGRSQTPRLVERRIAERLAWQRPKAIVSTLLLLVAVSVSALTWQNLVRRSRAPGRADARASAVLAVVGVVSVAASVILGLMVLGNTQGSVAPLSLTLFLG